MSNWTNSNALYDFDEDYCDQFPHPNTILKNVYFQSAVYSMYAIIFIVALIGNTFVCYVVLTSPRMRTVTNYFIMNLAIGDILITILCIPFTSVAMLNQHWQFGSFLCPVVSYAQAVSVFVSAYTLVAISIDKYMVIMWPLKPRISKKLAALVIAIVWLVAAVTVLPTYLFTSLVQPKSDNDSLNIYYKCDLYICKEDYSQVGLWYGELYSQILMGLQYIIPSVVLLFTYVSIAVVIWCHRIPGEAENSRDRRIARCKRKMIKMMATVVFVYTLCWLPFNILLIFSESISETVMTFLYFPLHGLAMSHACYNPIIYCYMNSRFRDGLYVILRNIPGLRRCVPFGMGRKRRRHTGQDGSTESTVLHRNNTCTSYISMKRKNFNRTSTTSSLSQCQPMPIRSASLMRHNSSSLHNNQHFNSGSLQNGHKRPRYASDIMEEAI